ncbi:hypothetical protein A499_21465 [Niallia nealsonii AAU1]|nr:hypothetical protein A499_21465 [Niallia nealsonii AAU1]
MSHLLIDKLHYYLLPIFIYFVFIATKGNAILFQNFLFLKITARLPSTFPRLTMPFFEEKIKVAIK